MWDPISEKAASTGKIAPPAPGFVLGRSDRVALINPETGSRTTYAALEDRVDDVASCLVGLGVRPGDVVASTLLNGPAAIVVFLGIARCGAAAAPLNPAYTEEEVGRYLEDLRPVLHVVESSIGGAARAAAERAGIAVAELSGTPDVPRIPTRVRGSVSGADPDAVTLLLHTSGTTGRPKVVPLRLRNLVASARAIGAHYGLGPDDVSHCVMPLFHVHGLVASTLATLLSGGAVIVPRRFSASGFWGDSVAGDATWYSAVPTIHQILLARSGAERPEHRLRFVRSCSSSLAPTVMRDYEERFGVPLVEAYGMTEAAHQMTANPLPPSERRPGSVGVPAGAEVAIVDEQWQREAALGIGEVVVRGPGVVDGYLANPEANAESFRDGWFRTGDSGYLDDDGYLHLAGRIKELINRAGEKISPSEIEDVLLRHPAVVEAVAFAMPDDTYGEIVAAAVVLRSAIDPDALRVHCGEHLAAFKIPSLIAVLDEVPKGPTGKIRRRSMPDLISAT